MHRDYDLALQVRGDDAAIDRFEVEVDDMAIHLLAKAPLAGRPAAHDGGHEDFPKP